MCDFRLLINMKLPTEPSAPSINAGSGNGYYGQNNHTVMVILAPPSPDPAQNGDFSEYFWMENEEEFDRQVRKLYVISNPPSLICVKCNSIIVIYHRRFLKSWKRRR